MIMQRLRQLLLLLFAAGIVFLGLFQMFMRLENAMPMRYMLLLSVAFALCIVFWSVLSHIQPFASQSILPCVVLLTGVGITMIARIDHQNGDTSFGTQQLVWACIALALCTVLVTVLRDYRMLRRFAYICMVIGLVLLLSPMIPGLGMEMYGARIWIHIGSHSLQPAEFAKLFLAIFFAAYLFDHRDQLAVGGKRIGSMHLPRLRDLGPILVVWAVCMGVLVIQHDLGTSLMFFAMFVSMLYVATGRKSWIALGGLFFVIGAIAASTIFAHVGNRIHAWLHAFDPQVYNAIGGSMQLVQGVFGLATGGLVGTGLGQGHPTVTPLSQSDYIYTSLGEELGLVGLFAILALYLVIITSGLLIALRNSDGFGKLLASGLVFTMAFQVFTVVGGITLVIPLTGLTLPYIASGGSSLIANYILMALLLVVSNTANKPDADVQSDTFQYAALLALREKEKEKAQKAALQAKRSRKARSLAITVPAEQLSQATTQTTIQTSDTHRNIASTDTAEMTEFPSTATMPILQDAAAQPQPDQSQTDQSQATETQTIRPQAGQVQSAQEQAGDEQ